MHTGHLNQRLNSLSPFTFSLKAEEIRNPHSSLPTVFHPALRSRERSYSLSNSKHLQLGDVWSPFAELMNLWPRPCSLVMWCLQLATWFSPGSNIFICSEHLVNQQVLLDSVSLTELCNQFLPRVLALTWTF